MAKISYVQNGVTKKKRGRRKNGTAKTTRKRNGVTKARALAFAKKNGLKLVSKTAQNGKRRKRRTKRNGVTSPRSTGIMAKNGLLGNTKQDAKRVASVMAGAAITKIASSLISGFAAPYAAQVGLGQYTGLVIDGVLALTVAPMIGKKIGGAQGADMARLGGLLVVGVDVLSLFAPSVLSYTPFNNAPVVLNGNTALLTPAAVTDVVNNTSATASEKAAVAGAMRALQSGSAKVGSVRRSGGRSMRPMFA